MDVIVNGGGSRGLIRAGLVLVPLALACLGVSPAAALAADAPTVAAPGPGSALASEVVERGENVSSLPGSGIPGPSRSTGTYTARILIDTVVRHSPAGRHVKWYARTRTKWSGSGQRLMILRSAHVSGRTWLKVRLPVRPNGSSGWIPRDRVRIARSREFIVIDRSKRVLRLYRKGRRVARFRVVVGAPGTPTPLGLFALQDRVRQPEPGDFIGPWAVPLTAHSEVLRRYDGGPGLVALHGRSGASLRDPLGSARSHGCVRMNNGRIARLARSPLATAVRIRK